MTKNTQSAPQHNHVTPALSEGYKDNPTDLAERVVSLRTSGFRLLQHAKPGASFGRWLVEKSTPTAAVLHDNERVTAGEDYTLSVSDLGNKGMLLRLHNFYAKTEAVEYVLLSNDEPKYFAASVHVGRKPRLRAHDPISERETNIASNHGWKLNAATAMALEEYLQPIETSIQDQTARQAAAGGELARLVLRPEQQR